MANPYRVGIELTMASNHAGVLAALSRTLLGIHPQIDSLIGHFDRLKTAIGGALGVTAGVEMIKVLKNLTEATAGYSHELVQLEKLGIGPEKVKGVEAEAWRVVKAVPSTTVTENMKITGAMFSMVGGRGDQTPGALGEVSERHPQQWR
jgi:hypothetical protein